MWIEVIICIFIIGVLTFTLIKALNRIELYRQKNDDLENFIIGIQQRTPKWLERLGEIDHNGSFESDDEVGYFFEELKQLVKEVDDFVMSEKIYGEK